MPDITKRQRYEQRKSALWLERSSFESQWREIATYLFPTRPRFTVTDRNRGDRRNQAILDATATFAANTLRAGMHSGLTSPARPWMKLSVPDPSLAKFPPVQRWLHEITERMHAVFWLSNLYNALPLVYGDMGVFGTAAVGILDDPGSPGKPGDLFRAYAYPVGSYALGLDARGLADTFIRETEKTVGQVVEEYGGENGQPLERGQTPDWSRFSRMVKDAYDRGAYDQTLKVIWIVTPNREYRANALGPEGFLWTSCHYEDGQNGGVFLRESGFHEFPILAPRWFTNVDDIYGTDCPGMMALGDVKQLQMMQRRKGQAIEKMVNPPLVGPMQLRSQKTSLLPGDITYVDAREGQQGLRPIHEVRPDLTHFVMDIQDVQMRINRHFFADLFLMLTYAGGSRGAQPPTAREIEERREEKLTALGPVLESTIDELLDPLVDRVFAMMLRAGLIPDAPQELDGVELTVEYTSILAQAMKMQKVGLLDRFLQTALPMSQAFPGVLDAVDDRKVLREYGDALGVSPDLLRTDDEIEARGAARAQAQAQQAQVEQAALEARAAKDLSQTSMTGDTALAALMQGVTG